MGQRLGTDGAGRAVLVKSAAPGPGSERLRREAVLLRAAAHPGVVELLDERTAADGGVELVLAVAGSRTIADLRTDLRGVADVVAALATTVADLHDVGLVHGRISPDHVVIAASGRPVLCGLAGAGPATDDRRPADDVASLGALLAGLVAPGGTGPEGAWEPIPDRRFGRTDRWQGYAQRALLTVVDQATADDPGRRPSARGFASAVLAARPEVRTRRLEGWRVPALPAPTRRAITAVAAAIGLGLLVFGVGALLRPTEPTPEVVTAPTVGPSTSAVPAPSLPGADLPVSECPPVTGPAADPDGDGCASAARLGDGVVEIDRVRYAVGHPGDLVAIGDWDCDGAATVALVRAGSGEVFVFDGWATGTASEEATSSATVPDPAGLESPDADGDGCPVLVVVDGNGDRTEVAA